MTAAHPTPSPREFRQLANTSPLIRACIELRKQELAWAEWDIAPAGQTAEDFAGRRADAVRFFRRPDPNYGTFTEWARAVAEEVLVVNACALYHHPARRKGCGLLGSSLASLDLMDTAAITPPPQPVLTKPALASALRYDDSGALDIPATEDAAPAAFGVPLAALGMTGTDPSTPLRPLGKELRAWFKSTIDGVLHGTCGAHDLEWAWIPGEGELAGVA